MFDDFISVSNHPLVAGSIPARLSLFAISALMILRFLRAPTRAPELSFFCLDCLRDLLFLQNRAKWAERKSKAAERSGGETLSAPSEFLISQQKVSWTNQSFFFPSQTINHQLYLF